MTIGLQIKPVHEEDPADVIWREVGDLDGIDVLFQNVLVAIYIRPVTKTAGGVFMAEKTVEEDRYQAKVGMVLKVGHTAFLDDEKNGVFFGGFRAVPGDWLTYRPSEGLKMQIGKRECRLIADFHVAKMRLTHPDQVY